MELRKNGNFLPDGEKTEYQKRRHYSYDAYVPNDFVYIDFNDFHEILKDHKNNTCCEIQKKSWVPWIPEFPAFSIRGGSPWLLERFIAGVEDAFASLEVDAKF